MMKKHYGSLFAIIVLLVVVCCIYGSSVGTARKQAKDSQKNEVAITASVAVESAGGMVTIEDEAVPVADSLTVNDSTVTQDSESETGGSILFLISGLLLLIIIVVVVIVATVAASTTVIEKF